MVAALDEAVLRSNLAARFTSAGPQLEPGGHGMDEVRGRIVVTVAAAIREPLAPAER